MGLLSYATPKYVSSTGKTVYGTTGVTVDAPAGAKAVWTPTSAELKAGGITVTTTKTGETVVKRPAYDIYGGIVKTIYGAAAPIQKVVTQGVASVSNIISSVKQPASSWASYVAVEPINLFGRQAGRLQRTFTGAGIGRQRAPGVQTIIPPLQYGKYGLGDLPYQTVFTGAGIGRQVAPSVQTIIPSLAGRGQDIFTGAGIGRQVAPSVQTLMPNLSGKGQDIFTGAGVGRQVAPSVQTIVPNISGRGRDIFTGSGVGRQTAPSVQSIIPPLKGGKYGLGNVFTGAGIGRQVAPSVQTLMPNLSGKGQDIFTGAGIGRQRAPGVQTIIPPLQYGRYGLNDIFTGAGVGRQIAPSVQTIIPAKSGYGVGFGKDIFTGGGAGYQLGTNIQTLIPGRSGYAPGLLYKKGQGFQIGLGIQDIVPPLQYGKYGLGDLPYQRIFTGAGIGKQRAPSVQDIMPTKAGYGVGFGKNIFTGAGVGRQIAPSVQSIIPPLKYGKYGLGDIQFPKTSEELDKFINIYYKGLNVGNPLYESTEPIRKEVKQFSLGTFEEIEQHPVRFAAITGFTFGAGAAFGAAAGTGARYLPRAFPLIEKGAGIGLTYLFGKDIYEQYLGVPSYQKAYGTGRIFGGSVLPVALGGYFYTQYPKLRDLWQTRGTKTIKYAEYDIVPFSKKELGIKRLVYLKRAKPFKLETFENINIKGVIDRIAPWVKKSTGEIKFGRKSGTIIERQYRWTPPEVKAYYEGEKAVSYYGLKGKVITQPTTRFPFASSKEHYKFFKSIQAKEYYLPGAPKGYYAGYSATPQKWKSNIIGADLPEYVSGKGTSAAFFRLNRNEYSLLGLDSSAAQGTQPFLYAEYTKKIKFNPGKEIQKQNPFDARAIKKVKQYIYTKPEVSGVFNIPGAKPEVEATFFAERTLPKLKYNVKFMGRTIGVQQSIIKPIPQVGVYRGGKEVGYSFVPTKVKVPKNTVIDMSSYTKPIVRGIFRPSSAISYGRATYIAPIYSAPPSSSVPQKSNVSRVLSSLSKGSSVSRPSYPSRPSSSSRAISSITKLPSSISKGSSISKSLASSYKEPPTKITSLFKPVKRKGIRKVFVLPKPIKFKAKYKPSLKAQLFKIKGRMPTEISVKSGLTIRPIIR